MEAGLVGAISRSASVVSVVILLASGLASLSMNGLIWRNAFGCGRVCTAKPTSVVIYKPCSSHLFPSFIQSRAVQLGIPNQKELVFYIPFFFFTHNQYFAMAPVLDPPQTIEWMGKQVPVWSMQTINYGLLLSQDPSEVDKVVNACLEDGYFYLDLRGIDGRRMLADHQETLKLMKRFFDAPLEQKNEFGLISSHLG